MKDSFLTSHLNDAGEHYFQHLLFTIRIGALLILAGAVIVIHGLMPFIMVNTGSNLIAHINRLLAERRARQKPAA
jgi:hypothetical protein